MFKILVVEDDKDLNRTVCVFLNTCGYSATGCLSAGDAYDAMYETVFDLIVSDIMMPCTASPPKRPRPGPSPWALWAP